MNETVELLDKRDEGRIGEHSETLELLMCEIKEIKARALKPSVKHFAFVVY